jgi:2-polyprenyl-3-methyl-5-hydroxy-6-metoxy-1,4-benzoquinol methylase
MYAAEVPSPLVATATAALVETRPTAPIAKLYLEQFGYDASEDFAGLDEIAVYECEATKYRFFYPFSLEGKERLYRAIEDTDWCYEEDKWEHNAVADRIPKDASVLDIGCGRGAFLSKVKDRRSQNVTGIELNKSAAAFTRERGIAVVETMLGEHAKDRAAGYDVVTAFQVLEHNADPITFLRDCIAALKPGGLLIIAVPNNDGFIRFDPNLPLNQPPHHVGLWTPRSLAALADILPIELQWIEEEPLRELDWYQQVMEHRYLPKWWHRSLYYRLGGDKIVKRFVAENAGSISGHTVIACYRHRPHDA